MKEGI